MRKLRKSGGVWLPAGILAAVVGGAIAWGTNANRLANVEQQQVEGKAETQRMETHLSANDQQLVALKEQLGALKDRLQLIIEQLAAANAKLDRAEEERRK